VRRELCSAERLSEASILLGSVSMKTPGFESSASLSWVTRRAKRLADDLPVAFLAIDCLRAECALPVVFAAVLPAVLSVEVLSAPALLEPAGFRSETRSVPYRFGRQRNHRPRQALTGAAPVSPGAFGCRSDPMDLPREMGRNTVALLALSCNRPALE
jgi:hypothetical protein